jgi:hypothetical protein
MRRSYFLLFLLFILTSSCSNVLDLGSDQKPDDPKSQNGRSEQHGQTGNSSTNTRSSVRCWPGDPNPGYDTTCNAETQLCVHDYAGISSFPKPNSCQPFITACAQDRTCDCVLDHFQCGITTSCSIGPEGIVRVVCQPD